MSEQATLGNSTPVVSEATLREKLEDHAWSPSELADELDVTEAQLKRALNAHGIEFNPHSVGAKASGGAKTLWEMSTDEFDEQVLGGESA